MEHRDENDAENKGKTSTKRSLFEASESKDPKAVREKHEERPSKRQRSGDCASAPASSSNGGASASASTSAEVTVAAGASAASPAPVGVAASAAVAAAATTTAVLPDLASRYGVVKGARLEVLWDLEDEETGEKKEVWWPCTVRGKAGIATMHDDGEGEGGDTASNQTYKTVGLQTHKILYDFLPAYPEYNTEEDLSDTVVVFSSHGLFDNGISSELLFRVEGSSWEPPPPTDANARAAFFALGDGGEGGSSGSSQVPPSPFEREMIRSGSGSKGDDGSINVSAGANSGDRARVMIDALVRSTIAPRVVALVQANAAAGRLVAEVVGSSKAVLEEMLSEVLEEKKRNGTFEVGAEDIKDMFKRGAPRLKAIMDQAKAKFAM